MICDYKPARKLHEINMSCSACKNYSIHNPEYMECIICHRFCILCLGIKKDDERSKKDVWTRLSLSHKSLCPSCFSSLLKNNISGSPARPIFTNHSDDEADAEDIYTMRECKQTTTTNLCAGSDVNVADILHEIGNLRDLFSEFKQLQKEFVSHEIGKLREEVSEIKELRKEFVSLHTQVNSISTTVNESAFDIKKKLDEAKCEISSLKSTILQSQRDLEMQKQNTVADKLEVASKPEEKNKDLFEDVHCKLAELSMALPETASDEKLIKRRPISLKAGEEIQPEEIITPAEIVQVLHSQDIVVKTVAARAARRMLTREQNPPISVMVDAGVLKPLVQALDQDDCADLQLEAAWAISNIASGTHEHTLAVIDAGAIPKLVSLLGRGGSVAEQSTYALGNIAGDGASPQATVLACGALAGLLPLLAPATAPSQLRTAVWAYSNMCRKKIPMVKMELVSPALPYISELLKITDEDVLTDACWALSYLTDGPIDRIEAVQNTDNLLPRLVCLLEHKSPAVRRPAMRALGNMLTGSAMQTDRCLNAGCLDHILTLLQCGKPFLIKEAAWAASNIFAGTNEQIQKAIDKGLIPKLLHVLATEDINCHKEATWAITNLCQGGTAQQLDALLSTEFLEPYCALLASPDHRALMLDGLTNLLQETEKNGKVKHLRIKLEEIGALNQIKALQPHHENKEVYTVLLCILAIFTDIKVGNNTYCLDKLETRELETRYF